MIVGVWGKVQFNPIWKWDFFTCDYFGRLGQKIFVQSLMAIKHPSGFLGLENTRILVVLVYPRTNIGLLLVSLRPQVTFRSSKLPPSKRRSGGRIQLPAW
jgi:hypothetical protein